MTIRECRAAYSELRDRAKAKTTEPRDLRYIDALYASWDNALAAYGDETEVNEVTSRHLTDTILSPGLSMTVLMEWLDAYPSGIEARLSD